MGIGYLKILSIWIQVAFRGLPPSPFLLILFLLFILFTSTSVLHHRQQTGITGPPLGNTVMQLSKTQQSVIQSTLPIVNHSRGNIRYHFLHEEKIRELSHAFLTCNMHKRPVADAQD